jgi:hypothetical protein
VINKLHGLGFALLVFSSTSACDQSSASIEVDLPSEINFADGFQQSDADAIIRKCEADDVLLTVESSGEITFMPSPASDYEAAACVLNYIKESGPDTRFGFVGNEKYVTPKEGQ